jgi:wyosine [tRNA(Phe)-imidazoG37] synthetase (radical SAM superfamily)
MKFIKMTDASDGKTVHVNMSLVICMNGDDEDTCIEFSFEAQVKVRETPEEIAALIAKAERDEAEEAMVRYNANVRSTFEASEAIVAPWRETVRQLADELDRALLRCNVDKDLIAEARALAGEA